MEGDQLAPEVRPASLSHLVSGPALGPTVGAQSLLTPAGSCAGVRTRA